MAKHDQRILKFLTQNAERAPTITDMMTRLNISISDITASLNSLMAQGMVSKRTNGQGIECWFPTNGASPQLGNELAQEPSGADSGRRASEFDRRAGDSRVFSGLNSPNPPEPSPLPPLQPTLPSLSASSAFPASIISSLTAPQGGKGSSPMESAVFAASPAAMAAASAGSSPSASSTFSPVQSPAPTAPGGPGLESLPGVTPPMNYGLAPAKSGVGFMTFLLGLLLVGGFSVWFSGRLVKQDLEKATKGFVEKAAMDEAVNSWTAFENTTKTHVKALEAQVKALTDSLNAMKASTDSLQALAAKGAADARKAGTTAKKTTRRRR